MRTTHMNSSRASPHEGRYPAHAADGEDAAAVMWTSRAAWSSASPWSDRRILQMIRAARCGRPFLVCVTTWIIPWSLRCLRCAAVEKWVLPAGADLSMPHDPSPSRQRSKLSRQPRR